MIELKNLKTNKDIAFTTDTTGTIKANLPKNENYQMTVTKLGYDPVIKQISTKDTIGKMVERIDIRKTIILRFFLP